MRTVLALSIFIVLSLSVVDSYAQFFSGLLPPSRQKTVLTYTGSIQPETEFNDNQNASMNRGLVTATVPFYQTEQEAWSVTMLGHWLDNYPDQKEMPDLYQFDVGLAYSRMTAAGKAYWAVNANWGSASDKPFKDSTVDTLSGNWFYIDPVDETASWIYLVNYSNNRPILNGIPLPGFAYMYNPSKSFRGTFGIPFATVYWEFVDRWAVNLFTLIPWVIKTSVEYSIQGPMKATLGLDFSQSTYYIFGRENRKDRLFYDEKRLYAGFKTPLSKTLMFETEVGYSFDRKYFTDENYDPSPKNAIFLGSSPYVKIQASAYF